MKTTAVREKASLYLRRDLTHSALYARSGSLESTVAFLEARGTRPVPQTDAELAVILADYDAWAAREHAAEDR